MSAVEDFPCEHCGAGPKEPCKRDCVAWQAEEIDWPTPLDTGEYEPLSRLAAAVHRLPYSGNVGVRGVGAPERGDDDAGYIEALADWMVEYQQVLSAMVQELEVQSRQRISMQIERDVLDGVIRRALEGTSA